MSVGMIYEECISAEADGESFLQLDEHEMAIMF